MPHLSRTPLPEERSQPTIQRLAGPRRDAGPTPAELQLPRAGLCRGGRRLKVSDSPHTAQQDLVGSLAGCGTTARLTPIAHP